jgi:hypothetical protein
MILLPKQTTPKTGVVCVFMMVIRNLNISKSFVESLNFGRLHDVDTSLYPFGRTWASLTMTPIVAD